MWKINTNGLRTALTGAKKSQPEANTAPSQLESVSSSMLLRNWHYLVLGATGTGKTTLVRNLVRNTSSRLIWVGGAHADLAALEVLHTRLTDHAQARRINDYYAANFAIHEAIITLADNRWLAQVIGDLRKMVKLARLQQLHAPGRLDQSLSEHLAVFAALKARDALGAEAAMRTHITRQRAALRELARNQTTRLST
jgi:DNA-binding GntR family transcriptional regulator